VDFSKSFSRVGGENGEICYFPLENKKAFLLQFSKSKGAKAPLLTPMVVKSHFANWKVREKHVF